MAFQSNDFDRQRLLPRTLEDLLLGWFSRLGGLGLLLLSGVVWLALLTWSANDPSLSNSSSNAPANFLGSSGAAISDLLLQTLGLSSVALLTCFVVWGIQMVVGERVDRFQVRAFFGAIAIFAIAGGASALPTASGWLFLHGYGGILGDISYNLFAGLFSQLGLPGSGFISGFALSLLGFWAFSWAIGLDRERLFLLVSPLGKRRAGDDKQRQATAANPQAEAPHQTLHAAPMMQAEPARGWLNFDNLNPAQTRLVEFGQVGGQTAPNDAEAPHVSRPFAPLPHQADPDLTQRPAAPAHALSIDPMAGPAAGPVAGPSESLCGEPAGDPGTDMSAARMAIRFAPGGQAAQDAQPEPQTPAHPTYEASGDGQLAEDADLPAFLGGTRRVLPQPAPEAPRAPEALRAQNTAKAKRSLSLNLLQASDGAGPLSSQRLAELRQTAEQLAEVLADFRVKGEITDIRPGPVVTLFEFVPARGTKSSRVIALADDVARSMSAASARISVIPGRNALGIELPNPSRETVTLRELLESAACKNCDARLPLALGKGIAGEPVVADLARMPHLLVAGTTGSGKSVGINAMILSLLYRKTPDDCRFLFIDPKMLELSAYNGIPHLLAPVITDPHQAVLALQWAVGEMEDRYKRMTDLGVRSIDVFNNRVRHARRSGEPMVQRVHTGFDPDSGAPRFEDKYLDVEPMPHVVIIVDEFADLMCVAGKEIEAAVQRLAQMARAAGMHLIMATQRPSVDVVTGTIKANFPTRIGFKVASKIDSRTILNEQGAEQLLGQGDMLLAAGGGPMIRAHGPFVADEEVEAVSQALQAQGPPAFSVELCAMLEGLAVPQPASQPAGQGDLFDKAVAIIREDGRVSTSYLQRRLSIGYNRAAGLIERLEEAGLITPADRAGKRQIVA